MFLSVADSTYAAHAAYAVQAAQVPSTASSALSSYYAPSAESPLRAHNGYHCDASGMYDSAAAAAMAGDAMGGDVERRHCGVTEPFTHMPAAYAAQWDAASQYDASEPPHSQPSAQWQPSIPWQSQSQSPSPAQLQQQHRVPNHTVAAAQPIMRRAVSEQLPSQLGAWPALFGARPGRGTALQSLCASPADGSPADGSPVEEFATPSPPDLSRMSTPPRAGEQRAGVAGGWGVPSRAQMHAARGEDVEPSADGRAGAAGAGTGLAGEYGDVGNGAGSVGGGGVQMWARAGGGMGHERMGGQAVAMDRMQPGTKTLTLPLSLTMEEEESNVPTTASRVM